MRKNHLWYNFWRYCVVKGGLLFFYKRVKVTGKENFPKGKPILIAPNHQNALIDALLIETHVPGTMFALTRSGVFSTKFSNWFLRSINMLPVYRVRDGLSSVTKNNAIFEQCIEYLGENLSVLIFPEANHDLRRRVRPLSKGFTRIAFDAQVKHNWDLDLQILPVGINYTEHRRSRNNVQIVYGKPISVKDYKELYEIDERKAANQLKSDVSDEMKQTVMHVPNLDQYPAMQVLLTDLENDENEYINPSKVNEKVEKLSDKLTPELIDIGKQVVEISNNHDISIKTVNGRKRPWMYWVLLFPLYLFSWLNNIIPYQPIRNLLRTKIKDHAFDATVKYMLSLFLFPLFWILISIILLITGVPGMYILGYLVLSGFTSVYFKNANHLFREASTKKRLKALRIEKPEVYKTFIEGINSLNEFRQKALS
jgi:1-acyl-sn-glycerol-3-phosphate acyltransferase